MTIDKWLLKISNRYQGIVSTFPSFFIQRGDC